MLLLYLQGGVNVEAMNNTVNMTIRIDKDFKKETDSLFKDLGINTTSAILMFLKQCHREQGLPFTASLLAPAPNKEFQSALIEAEEIRKDKNRKGYSNISDLMKALDD